MSEVLYNTQYYPHLFDLTKACLASEDSKVIIATKTYYFGLGGGRFELQMFLSKNVQKYQKQVEVLLTINDSISIERMILGLTKAIQPEGDDGVDPNEASQEPMNTAEETFQLMF